jgi:hypothetical protein
MSFILYVLWHNHWSHSGFLLKMDLLHTNMVAVTNTSIITLSYPCLLHCKTLNSTAGNICSLLVFLFIFQSICASHTPTSRASNMALCACCATTDLVTQLPVKLISVPPLLALLFQHWLGTTDSTLAVTTDFTTLLCHAVPLTLPLVAGDYVHIRTQNTLHSSRRNSFRCR